MRQALYIHAATAISPQQSFKKELFLNEVFTSDSGMLYVVDAPYQHYISPVAIRRMSRVLKFTISAAMQCLAEAGIKTPDGIITGTGRGGVMDMEMFVKDLIRLEEGAMNPTAFIQSTYNSPNGWIAMQSGCTNYNQTYVHRGCSFELALQDAQMLLAENSGQQKLLVGCFDEMTEDYYIIRGKRAYWKKERIDSRELLRYSDTLGTIGGEGAAFFVLSNEIKGASSSIEAFRIIHQSTQYNIATAVKEVLEEAGKQIEDISFVLTGINGDCEQTKLYEKALGIVDKTMPLGAFKHLSGEYDTSTGFGLWLSNYVITNNTIPEALMWKSEVPEHVTHVLFINHYILGSSSVSLISKC